jgi:membrane protein involved in colicin uptake
MSTPDPASRAAELAAKQVEQIVEAAQLAAEEIKADAERRLVERQTALEADFAKRQAELEADATKARGEAEAEIARLRAEAETEATRLREEAQAEAIRVAEQSRKEAAERVAVAEQAADEALGDARAISAGLRNLGQSLEEYAERILRDVQAGHRRLRGDLRIAGGGSPATPGERARRSTSSAAPRSERRVASDRGNPLEDIDVPTWVAGEE